MRIDGESRAKDSDSKFEHIFKKIEKGITEEKIVKYRKLYENSKATHSKETHFIDAKFEVKADNQTNESGAPANPTPPVSRPQIPKITDILKETIRPSNKPLLEENLSKLETMREKHKPPKKDVNLLQDLVNSRVEPVVKLVDMLRENAEKKKQEETEKEKLEEDVGTKLEYVSKPKSELSSGETYYYEDLRKLNGETLQVVNDGQAPHTITINLEDEVYESMLEICKKFQIDPSLIMAVIAHESGFDKNATSYANAVGLTQVLMEYFYANAEPHKDFIISLGGDYEDPYDPITNMVAWSNGLMTWFDTYGETEEALRALRQGYKGSGWSDGAIENGKEFIDLKKQIDNYLFKGRV